MLNTTSSTAAVDDDEDDEMHPPDGSKSLADAANAERVHRPNQALPLRTHAPTTTISNSRAGRQSSSWTVASSSSQMSPVHGQTVSMLVASQPQVALNQAPPETMTMQSATSSYIPRPPNAFILFRSSFIRSEKISGKVEGNHSTLSKIIGMLWRNLPPPEREEWEAKAVVAQAEHRKRYPDWRFRPGANAMVKAQTRAKVKRKQDKAREKQVKQEDADALAGHNSEQDDNSGDYAVAPGRTRGRGTGRGRGRPRGSASAAGGMRGRGSLAMSRDETSNSLSIQPSTPPPEPRAASRSPSKLKGKGKAKATPTDERKEERNSKIADLVIQGKGGIDLELALEEWEDQLETRRRIRRSNRLASRKARQPSVESDEADDAQFQHTLSLPGKETRDDQYDYDEVFSAAAPNNATSSTPLPPGHVLSFSVPLRRQASPMTPLPPLGVDDSPSNWNIPNYGSSPEEPHNPASPDLLSSPYPPTSPPSPDKVSETEHGISGAPQLDGYLNRLPSGSASLRRSLSAPAPYSRAGKSRAATDVGLGSSSMIQNESQPSTGHSLTTAWGDPHSGFNPEHQYPGYLSPASSSPVFSNASHSVQSYSPQRVTRHARAHSHSVSFLQPPSRHVADSAYQYSIDPPEEAQHSPDGLELPPAWTAHASSSTWSWDSPNSYDHAASPTVQSEAGIGQEVVTLEPRTRLQTPLEDHVLETYSGGPHSSFVTTHSSHQEVNDLWNWTTVPMDGNTYTRIVDPYYRNEDQDRSGQNIQTIPSSTFSTLSGWDGEQTSHQNQNFTTDKPANTWYQGSSWGVQSIGLHNTSGWDSGSLEDNLNSDNNHS